MTTRTAPVFTRGDRLKKARTNAGYTPEQMAALLRVHVRTVNNYEADRTRVPHAVVVMWADLTDSPVEFFDAHTSAWVTAVEMGTTMLGFGARLWRGRRSAQAVAAA